MSNKLTTGEFIEKARKVHSDEYDYSKTNYIGNWKKVEIKHKKCGKWFWQAAMGHLRGNGCDSCSGTAKSTTEWFIEKARKIHCDEYDYSKVKYNGVENKVEIKHNKCGKWFWQTPNNHLKGNRCDYCSGTIKLTTEEFIKKAKIVHGSEYDYDNVDYVNAKIKVKIKHKKCKRYFQQVPNYHLSGNGCPYCNCSKMEIAVEKYLTGKNIEYETQKKYNGCKDRGKLPFDFYLPRFNILIECQGRHHYSPILDWYESKEQAFEQLRDRIKKDKIKRKYARKCRIKLIEINYKDIKRIPEILNEELNDRKEDKQLTFEL